MQSVTTTDGRTNDTDGSTGVRRAVDAAVADLAEAENYDHRELADALLEARDTLLVTGRVPDWFGQETAAAYRHMDRE